MQVPENRFKRGLQSGKMQLGLWSSLANHLSVEVLAHAGFDWLLLDTEHAPNELPMVVNQLLAAGGGTAQPIVRPPWNDTVTLKRFLDAGVQSFLVPFVQSAEEAQRAVAATRYPPRGVRGFAAGSRASQYGRMKDYFGTCEAQICVLVQVENQLGLKNLEAIAGVEGVDGIFIGPGDLSADLGHLGDPGHPEVQRVIEDAIARLGACRMPAGILTSRRELARRYIDLGCLFVAVGSDIGLLTQGASALVAEFGEHGTPLTSRV
ncbi:MAG: HpcH/HpaI aldolase/citrate lyase family protein [Burkholderiaceae bacterium]|jgi:4-hydroxy-2-oxoheptanedioate aldolase